MAGDEENLGIDDGNVFVVNSDGAVVDTDVVSSEERLMVALLWYSFGFHRKLTNLPRSDTASNRKVGHFSLVQDIVSCRSLSKVSQNDFIPYEIYRTLSTIGRRRVKGLVMRVCRWSNERASG